MFLSVLTIAMFLLAIPSTNASYPGIQDITGAAARIFGRPADPEVRHRAPSRTPSNKSAEAQDLIEDALELANSARNANPPRYHDAEVAYRLAAKLNPKDPRPLMGLANIWYDQQQYAAAAKMYKEALSTMTATSSGGGGFLRGELLPKQRLLTAQLRASSGIALLQTENFAEAQADFERSVTSEPTNARWHALKGYSLFKLGKISEARKAYQEALRLDHGNADYQRLVESTPQ